MTALEDTALVVPYDWGGWSALRVQATLTDGTHLTGEMAESAASEIRLPESRPNSHIASSWREETGIETGADEQDEEDGLGDGLSLYEEYRGFYEGPADVHTTGSATKRDLFVVDADSLAAAGCLLYSHAADVDVHCSLREPQLEAKVINANHGYAHLRLQHGLVVRNRGSDLNASGWTRVLGRTYGGSAPPAKIDRIEIYSELCTSKAEIAETLAHELGHGTGLPHHGRGDRSILLRRGTSGVLEEVNQQGVVTQVAEVIDEAGVAWPSSAFDNQGLGFLLGAWRGESSGEEHCLMRYQANAYAEEGPSRVIRIFPTRVAPTGFCETNQGASFNAGEVHPPSIFGPAMVGFDKLRTLIKDPL